MQHHHQSIILKRTAYGEADWIVAFLTRDAGRMSGIAKSARKSQKRFGGALELGTIVDLAYTAHRSSDLVRIESAEALLPPLGIMKSLERIQAMSRALTACAQPFYRPIQLLPTVTC